MTFKNSLPRVSPVEQARFSLERLLMKGNEEDILREVLDPSHKIDPKYAMHLILDIDGNTVSGIVVKEDDDNVTLLTNPESKEPTIIAQDDIEEMVKSSTSMTPKALMDQYSKAEIFELMGYLKSVSPEKSE